MLVVGDAVRSAEHAAKNVSKGDPAMVNMRGEQVILNGKGLYTLVEVPRYAVNPAVFRMTADIQTFSRNTHHSYIVGLKISGTSLGTTKQIHVRAAGNDHHFGVRIGDNETWTSLHELGTKRKVAPHKGVHLTRNFFNNTVIIDIGDVHLRILRPHKARHHVWNWLNVFVSGMKKFRLPVGGILGLDPLSKPSESPVSTAIDRA